MLVMGGIVGGAGPGATPVGGAKLRAGWRDTLSTVGNLPIRESRRRIIDRREDINDADGLLF